MITTQNQKPNKLKSHYIDGIAGSFDPAAIVNNIVKESLFEPLIKSQPVEIIQDNKPLSPKDITDMLFNCSGDLYNPQTESVIKEIFSQTLPFYDPSFFVQDVYAVQSGKSQNMLMPSDKVLYTPVDVIDASKQFLADQINSDGFFATMAFYTRIQSLGFYFANELVWTEFQNWFTNEIQQLQGVLPPDTYNLCMDFTQLKLNKLTESIILRNADDENNDPYSFARVLLFYLMLYEQNMIQNKQPAYIMGRMPFAFAENICPKTLIFINVEKHAHSKPNEIKTEWDVIKASLVTKPNIINTKQIMKLTAIARMAKKMHSVSAARKASAAMRSAIIRFRKTPPTSVDLYEHIIKIYKYTMFVQKSENDISTKKASYQKASRREPDNVDKMGMVNTKIYRPDLHIYLDCSGSISEREYQDAIKACIKLAKKMNINFYFTSFSHRMSSISKLHIKGRSVKQIYNEFKNIPKVGGGTDYEQIWHYINRYRRLTNQVSIVISDFEWTAPNHYVKHPKFLYYAPISTSTWSTLTRDAEDFCKSMLPICPNIRTKVLI